MQITKIITRGEAEYDYLSYGTRRSYAVSYANLIPYCEVAKVTARDEAECNNSRNLTISC